MSLVDQDGLSALHSLVICGPFDLNLNIMKAIGGSDYFGQGGQSVQANTAGRRGEIGGV